MARRVEAMARAVVTEDVRREVDGDRPTPSTPASARGANVGMDIRYCPPGGMLHSANEAVTVQVPRRLADCDGGGCCCCPGWRRDANGKRQQHRRAWQASAGGVQNGRLPSRLCVAGRGSVAPG
ncbi:hypothetical protein DPSP01_008478 [Paraphaeosphaeria sporulosa]